MKDYEWLAGLKAGDEVYESGPYGGVPTPATVSRTTPTMIMVEHKNFTGKGFEHRYNRKNGNSVGSDCWSSTCLIQPTDDVRNLAEINLLKIIAKGLRDKLSIPTDIGELKALIAAIRPFVKTPETMGKPKDTPPPPVISGT